MSNNPHDTRVRRGVSHRSCRVVLGQALSPIRWLVGIVLITTFAPAWSATPNAAATSCEPIPGLESEEISKARFLVFGELHGTTEVPAFVGDVACLVSGKRPVIVAIELPVVDEERTNAFVHSKGAKSDIDRLLQTGAWGGTHQWGATSIAMFRLVERVRILREHGRRISLAHFMPVVTGEVPQSTYETLTADELNKIAARNPNAIVVVLTGNIHARRTELTSMDSVMPAVAHLPASDVLSFNMRGSGGAAWNCQSDGCGPHKLGEIPPLKPKGLYRTNSANTAYDGEFSVGKPFTPSPPATSLLKP